MDLTALERLLSEQSAGWRDDELNAERMRSGVAPWGRSRQAIYMALKDSPRGELRERLAKTRFEFVRRNGG